MQVMVRVSRQVLFSCLLVVILMNVMLTKMNVAGRDAN